MSPQGKASSPHAAATRKHCHSQARRPHHRGKFLNSTPGIQVSVQTRGILKRGNYPARNSRFSILLQWTFLRASPNDTIYKVLPTSILVGGSLWEQLQHPFDNPSKFNWPGLLKKLQKPCSHASIQQQICKGYASRNMKNHPTYFCSTILSNPDVSSLFKVTEFILGPSLTTS